MKYADTQLICSSVVIVAKMAFILTLVLAFRLCHLKVQLCTVAAFARVVQVTGQVVVVVLGFYVPPTAKAIRRPVQDW